MSDAHVLEEPGGTITVPGAVLSHVVVAAAESVDGVRVRRPRRGLELDVDDGRGRVAVELAVRYGEVLPEVAGEVQLRVRAALLDICGLDTSAVDVSVEELDG
jgi:uncharacterized alkaline shock family protein YloU